MGSNKRIADPPNIWLSINSLYESWPSFSAGLRDKTPGWFTMTPLSEVMGSVEVSSNGFPKWMKLSFYKYNLLFTCFWNEPYCPWWFGGLFKIRSLNSSYNLSISEPDIFHFFVMEGSWVTFISPRSDLTLALCCSCARSTANSYFRQMAFYAFILSTDEWIYQLVILTIPV